MYLPCSLCLRVWPRYLSVKPETDISSFNISTFSKKSLEFEEFSFKAGLKRLLGLKEKEKKYFICLQYRLFENININSIDRSLNISDYAWLLLGVGVSTHVYIVYCTSIYLYIYRTAPWSYYEELPKSERVLFVPVSMSVCLKAFFLNLETSLLFCEVLVTWGKRLFHFSRA